VGRAGHYRVIVVGGAAGHKPPAPHFIRSSSQTPAGIPPTPRLPQSKSRRPAELGQVKILVRDRVAPVTDAAHGRMRPGNCVQSPSKYGGLAPVRGGGHFATRQATVIDVESPSRRERSADYDDPPSQGGRRHPGGGSRPGGGWSWYASQVICYAVGMRARRFVMRLVCKIGLVWARGRITNPGGSPKPLGLGTLTQRRAFGKWDFLTAGWPSCQGGRFRWVVCVPRAAQSIFPLGRNDFRKPSVARPRAEGICLKKRLERLRNMRRRSR
jgi:hypothetical protein